MKKSIICTKYANKLGVPKAEADHGIWLGSWVKSPVGRFIGTAYTHYAIIWDKLIGTSGKVVFYHNRLGSKFMLLS